MRQSRGLNYPRTQVRNKQNIKHTPLWRCTWRLVFPAARTFSTEQGFIFGGAAALRLRPTTEITQNNGRAADNGESNFLKGQQRPTRTKASSELGGGGAREIFSPFARGSA